MSVGLQGSYIFTPDPDLLANRRPSRPFSYSAISATSASLGSLSAINYRAELCILLYNYGNTLIYLYLDLQLEYYQLSLYFIDPCLITDSHESGFRSVIYRIRCRKAQSTIMIDLKLFLFDIFDP
jgi:hypothetical protein